MTLQNIITISCLFLRQFINLQLSVVYGKYHLPLPSGLSDSNELFIYYGQLTVPVADHDDTNVKTHVYNTILF